jgi:hypothetical protein
MAYSNRQRRTDKLPAQTEKFVRNAYPLAFENRATGTPENLEICGRAALPGPHVKRVATAAARLLS